MTKRTLAARHEADLDSADSPAALMWFLSIEHPQLLDPIRVVSDLFDYVINGHTYVGMPFEVLPLTDNNQTPSAELRVQNIDRRIGQALEIDTAGTRAIVSASAHSSDDFDLTVEPRVPLDANDLPTIYQFQRFELADVRANAVEITGRITLIDITQEPWPYIRATADRFPGLFV
ncbi:DUF1833 family protein [Citreimonas sp.]|uniref:DUF1833 family protein n=1 Tax=Citreimonas sp. TaxID=3036715 RepID=UPI00405A016D